MDSVIQKFRKVFLEEAQGLLNSYESDLLQLEKNPDDHNLIESAFRSMHTLKGTSGMYGFEYITELTHKLESIFQSVIEKQFVFNKELFDTTFSVIDHLRKLLFDELLSDEALKQEHKDLMSSISTFSSSISLNSSTSKSPEKEKINNQSLWHILLQTTESQYFRGISIMNILRELAGLGCFTIEKIENKSNAQTEIWSITLLTNSNEDEIREVFLFIEDDCSFVHIADIKESSINGINSYTVKTEEKELSILEAIKLSNIQKKESKVIEETVPKTINHDLKRISVDSAKLDHLMFLVSELITINSQLALSAKIKEFDNIKRNIEKLDSLSKEFRNNALEIRLVPISDMILRFQRLIRDLSKQLGKKVELVTHGIETELDKNTIDQLAEPLMHIIRNCIDHGVELPTVRVSKGKPETGHIKISANHSGNYIVIKIEDDGTGIDRKKVFQKAVDKGIFKPDDKPSPKELFDLIFLPGFSTAQNLTEVSGRGVGMDVVRRRIIDLRGDVSVDSEEGVGTTFTLKLQQSVAIIDTLLFTVENVYLIVPLSDITICSQISSDEIDQRRHNGTVPFNNQLIPFIDLRQKFALGGGYQKKIKVIVIQDATTMVALLVDRIVGEHQAVLKPLGKSFIDQPLLSSASQLGDSNLAFMIDTNLILSDIEGTKRKVKQIN